MIIRVFATREPAKPLKDKNHHMLIYWHVVVFI